MMGYVTSQVYGLAHTKVACTFSTVEGSPKQIFDWVEPASIKSSSVVTLHMLQEIALDVEFGMMISIAKPFHSMVLRLVIIPFISVREEMIVKLAVSESTDIWL